MNLSVSEIVIRIEGQGYGMTRSQRYPIPVKQIPKGIRLCYENCKRLLGDAVLLEEKKPK